MAPKAIAVTRVFLFLLVCPMVLIVASRVTKTVAPEVVPLLVGVISSGLTLVITLLFVRWDGITLNDVGAGISKGSAPRFLLGFLVGVAIVSLQNLAVYAGGHAHWLIEKSHPSPVAILLAFTSYFMLALREELSFRGYPLRRMEDVWGTWTAVVALAVVFTLEHAAGGWGWSRALLGPPMGAVLFGVAALATRGLAVPLGIHAAFNFGQWFVGQKENTGALRLIVETGFSKQAEALGYAGYWLAMTVAAAGFVVWRHRRNPEVCDIAGERGTRPCKQGKDEAPRG